MCMRCQQSVIHVQYQTQLTVEWRLIRLPVRRHQLFFLQLACRSASGDRMHLRQHFLSSSFSVLNITDVSKRHRRFQDYLPVESSSLMPNRLLLNLISSGLEPQPLTPLARLINVICRKKLLQVSHAELALNRLH